MLVHLDLVDLQCNGTGRWGGELVSVGIQGAPPTEQKILNFMQFLETFGKSYMLPTPCWRADAPSYGNPGSAPECVSQNAMGQVREGVVCVCVPGGGTHPTGMHPMTTKRSQSEFPWKKRNPCLGVFSFFFFAGKFTLVSLPFHSKQVLPMFQPKLMESFQFGTFWLVEGHLLLAIKNIFSLEKLPCVMSNVRGWSRAPRAKQEGHHSWMLVISGCGDLLLNVLGAKRSHAWRLIISGGGDHLLNAGMLSCIILVKKGIPVD